MKPIKLEHVEILGEEPRFIVKTKEIEETLLFVKNILERKKEKRVLLLHGPYGSGKTYILNNVNKYLKSRNDTKVFLVDYARADTSNPNNLHAYIIRIALDELLELPDFKGSSLFGEPGSEYIDLIIKYYARERPEIKNFVFLIDELDKNIAGVNRRRDEEALNSISVFCTDRAERTIRVGEREIQIIFIMGFSSRVIERFEQKWYESEAIRRLEKYERIRLNPDFGIKSFHEVLSKQLESRGIQGKNEVNGFNIFPFPEIAVNMLYHQNKGNIGNTIMALDRFYKEAPKDIKLDPNIVERLEEYFRRNWKSITIFRTGALERYLDKNRETPEIKAVELAIMEAMFNQEKKIKQSKIDKIYQEVELDHDILHDTIMSDFFQEDVSSGDEDAIYEVDEKIAEFFGTEETLQTKKGSTDIPSIIKLNPSLIREDRFDYALKKFAKEVFPEMCSKYQKTFTINAQVEEGGAAIYFIDYFVESQKFPSSFVLRMLLLPNESPSEKEIEEIRSLTKDINKIYLFCGPIDPGKYKDIIPRSTQQKKSSINPYLQLSHCFFYMINAKKIKGIEGFRRYKKTLLICAAKSDALADRAEIDQEDFYSKLTEFLHKTEILKLYSLFDSADFVSDLPFYLQIERFLRLNCSLHWKLLFEFECNEKEFMTEIEEIAAGIGDIRPVVRGHLLSELGIINKKNGNFIFVTKEREEYQKSPFESSIIDILTQTFKETTIQFSEFRRELISEQPALENLSPRKLNNILQGYLKILELRGEIALEPSMGRPRNIVFKPEERLKSQIDLLSKLGHPETIEEIIKNESTTISGKIAEMEKVINQIQKKRKKFETNKKAAIEKIDEVINEAVDLIQKHESLFKIDPDQLKNDPFNISEELEGISGRSSSFTEFIRSFSSNLKEEKDKFQCLDETIQPKEELKSLLLEEKLQKLKNDSRELQKSFIQIFQRILTSLESIFSNLGIVPEELSMITHYEMMKDTIGKDIDLISESDISFLKNFSYWTEQIFSEVRKLAVSHIWDDIHEIKNEAAKAENITQLVKAADSFRREFEVKKEEFIKEILERDTAAGRIIRELRRKNRINFGEVKAISSINDPDEIIRLLIELNKYEIINIIIEPLEKEHK